MLIMYPILIITAEQVNTYIFRSLQARIKTKDVSMLNHGNIPAIYRQFTVPLCLLSLASLFYKGLFRTT